MYLSNSLFIDVWSRDAGTFGYSLTRGAGYWLKLGGVGSSVRPRSLGGNITPSTGYSVRFSLTVFPYLFPISFLVPAFPIHFSFPLPFPFLSLLLAVVPILIFSTKKKKKKRKTTAKSHIIWLIFFSGRGAR